MKIILLGVVLVVCRADVTGHINERVFGKIIKTVITKALSSVDNVMLVAPCHSHANIHSYLIIHTCVQMHLRDICMYVCMYVRTYIHTNIT